MIKIKIKKSESFLEKYKTVNEQGETIYKIDGSNFVARWGAFFGIVGINTLLWNKFLSPYANIQTITYGQMILLKFLINGLFGSINSVDFRKRLLAAVEKK